MSDMMVFPHTVEEFMRQYRVVDTEGIYMSKGAELVPIFRMRQWFEHLPSTQPEGIYYVKFSEEDYEKIAEQLRKIPIVLTLSEPEIVRCAECKWFQYNMRFDGHLPKGVDEFECRHWCGSCDPTDFCSYAERKWEEDEDE